MGDLLVKMKAKGLGTIPSAHASVASDKQVVTSPILPALAPKRTLPSPRTMQLQRRQQSSSLLRDKSEVSKRHGSSPSSSAETSFKKTARRQEDDTRNTSSDERSSESPSPAYADDTDHEPLVVRDDAAHDQGTSGHAA